MLTRRTFLALSGAAALTPSMGLAESGVAITGGDAFGTYWRLTVPETATVDTQALAAIIEEIDVTFSPFRADSALVAFNRADTTHWLPASQAFREVLGMGLRIASETGGSFDPTIGPLVSRYGFGPIHADAWGAFEELGVNNEAVRKTDARLSLDLCGIAKGYALDRMARELTAQGVGAFLLDLGGELRARGQHPSGRRWQVAVESLDGALPFIVALDGRAIATSGIGAQSYRLGDNIVSHIIDPASGRPVGGDMVTASVLAGDATLADGWATALMAMGHEKALETAGRLRIDALLFIRDGDGLRAVATGNFADHILG